MPSTEISNREDVLDSRDIIARIEELETDLVDAHEASASPLTFEEWLLETAADSAATLQDAAAEFIPLKDLAGNGESYSEDWQYGATLIRDSYFETYTEELAGDIGAINTDATWPNNCIDWARAARELQQDYTAVEFDGVTYWTR